MYVETMDGTSFEPFESLKQLNLAETNQVLVKLNDLKEEESNYDKD